MASKNVLTEQEILCFTFILGFCTLLLILKASSAFKKNGVTAVPSLATIDAGNAKSGLSLSTTALSAAEGGGTSAAEATGAIAAAETVHDASRTVLIVDDDPVTRMQLRRNLERLNLRVKEVSDGPSAVQLYREGFRFCMVVMDYEMPDMNGLLTTKKIRSFDNDVVIVGSTIHDPATKQNEFLQAGANFVDIKPISAERLSEFVAEYNLAPAQNGQ